MGLLTSAQTSLLVASTWVSGLLPASPKHGTTSLAILSSVFTNHTVRLGVLHPLQIPFIGQTTDRQSKVFEPTTIEIRFQHLHEVEEGSQEASLVPFVERQPSPEDGPRYIRSGFFFLVSYMYYPDVIALTVLCLCRPRDDVMQSAFAAPEDDQYLTFVILFYPPVPTMIFPPISTTAIPNLESGPGSYHAAYNVSLVS